LIPDVIAADADYIDGKKPFPELNPSKLQQLSSYRSTDHDDDRKNTTARGEACEPSRGAREVTKVREESYDSSTWARTEGDGCLCGVTSTVLYGDSTT
jgi:hypothetical protein